MAEADKSDPLRLKRRKTAMLFFGGFFLATGLLWLFYWLLFGQFKIYTDDAYVNGNMVQLMSQIPGTVTEIDADDTEPVQQNQIIIKFDPDDMNIALQRAKANLAETVRQVRKLFENTKQAEATLILRKADLIKARLDLKRRTGLIGHSAVSHEEYQHYLTAEKNAEARYNAAWHDLRSREALVVNTRLYTHPLVEKAKANFKTAWLNAQRTIIRAPLSGIVAKRSIQVGQRVLVNTPMLAIVPLDQTWVDANYRETQLANLRVGQPVILYPDAYPGVTYHGKVFGLNAGTGAAFSLLPPQNATGNWIKIVQRLPVRIWLNPDELKKHPLQLGLSMRVTTDIHNTSGPMVAARPSGQPLYMTDIYSQQMANANQQINAILKNNSPDMFIRELR